MTTYKPGDPNNSPMSNSIFSSHIDRHKRYDGILYFLITVFHFFFVEKSENCAGESSQSRRSPAWGSLIVVVNWKAAESRLVPGSYVHHTRLTCSDEQENFCIHGPTFLSPLQLLLVRGNQQSQSASTFFE